MPVGILILLGNSLQFRGDHHFRRWNRWSRTLSLVFVIHLPLEHSPVRSVSVTTKGNYADNFALGRSSWTQKRLQEPLFKRTQMANGARS